MFNRTQTCVLYSTGSICSLSSINHCLQDIGDRLVIDGSSLIGSTTLQEDAFDVDAGQKSLFDAILRQVSSFAFRRIRPADTVHIELTYPFYARTLYYTDM